MCLHEIDRLTPFRSDETTTPGLYPGAVFLSLSLYISGTGDEPYVSLLPQQSSNNYLDIQRIALRIKMTEADGLPTRGSVCRNVRCDLQLILDHLSATLMHSYFNTCYICSGAYSLVLDLVREARCQRTLELFSFQSSG